MIQWKFQQNVVIHNKKKKQEASRMYIQYPEMWHFLSRTSTVYSIIYNQNLLKHLPFSNLMLNVFVHNLLVEDKGYIIWLVGWLVSWLIGGVFFFINIIIECEKKGLINKEKKNLRQKISFFFF